MSGRAPVVALCLIAALAWAGLVFIVVNVSPEAWVSRLLFFAFFYVALVSTLGLVAYFLSFRLFASRANRGNLVRSAQQGGLWATFALVAALLQALRMLNWVNGTLLLGLLVVAQLLMLARFSGKPQYVPREERPWEEIDL